MQRLLWWLRQQRTCLQFRTPGFSPWMEKIPLEKGMTTHSSIPAWRIPWAEEPGKRAVVHEVAKSQTQLSDLHLYFPYYTQSTCRIKLCSFRIEFNRKGLP